MDKFDALLDGRTNTGLAVLLLRASSETRTDGYPLRQRWSWQYVLSGYDHRIRRESLREWRRPTYLMHPRERRVDKLAHDQRCNEVLDLSYRVINDPTDVFALSEALLIVREVDPVILRRFVYLISISEAAGS